MRLLSDLCLHGALLCSLLFVGLVASVESGCATHANAPVTQNLSPTGLDEYNKTRAIHALDIIRDAAIDGEKVGVFAHADTVHVVTFHKSTVQVISASTTGWKPAVQTALNELTKALSASAQTKVAPYVALVSAILQEVN
jgi:hypothetical protein